jgi:hypothetical protein
VTYFVKLLGASDMPMRDHPWPEREINEEVRFPPKPPPKDVTKGDVLVYYAVGGFRRIFAVARIDGPPILNPRHENPVIAKRYPYAAPVSLQPDVKLEYVSSGPELKDVGRDLQSKIGQGVSSFRDRAAGVRAGCRAASQGEAGGSEKDQDRMDAVSTEGTMSDVFSYRATKSGEVHISWQGKPVTTLRGGPAVSSLAPRGSIRMDCSS